MLKSYSIKSNNINLLTKKDCLQIICKDLQLSKEDKTFYLKTYNLQHPNDLFGFAGEYHRLQITIEIKVNYI